jgi:transcriptional regulator with XRE-family HTH domain
VTLAKRLKKARLEAGLSTRALGKIIGVSFSSIARIERGEGQPTVHSAERIERWLKDGSQSEPVRRTVNELSRMDRMELKLVHLDGIVTGILARLDRMAGPCS